MHINDYRLKQKCPKSDTIRNKVQLINTYIFHYLLEKALPIGCYDFEIEIGNHIPTIHNWFIYKIFCKSQSNWNMVIRCHYFTTYSQMALDTFYKSAWTYLGNALSLTIIDWSCSLTEYFLSKTHQFNLQNVFTTIIVKTRSQPVRALDFDIKTKCSCLLEFLL